MIMIKVTFLSGMPGFRDNEVLLQAGNDVIVISPSGRAEPNFLIADFERATPILYYCTVFDLMNFSCLPERTS